MSKAVCNIVRKPYILIEKRHRKFAPSRNKDPELPAAQRKRFCQTFTLQGFWPSWCKVILALGNTSYGFVSTT